MKVYLKALSFMLYPAMFIGLTIFYPWIGVALLGAGLLGMTMWLNIETVRDDGDYGLAILISTMFTPMVALSFWGSYQLYNKLPM